MRLGIVADAVCNVNARIEAHLSMAKCTSPPARKTYLCFFKVESGSPGLARLLCLALTGSSAGDSAPSGNAMGSDEVVKAAASAGFLDDEAFFQHFFTRLVDWSGDGNEGASPVDVTIGDEAEARILEQVIPASLLAGSFHEESTPQSY